MEPRKLIAPDYEQEAAIADAQQMADDDMWNAYATELEHHHKPLHIDLDATEGAKP